MYFALFPSIASYLKFYSSTPRTVDIHLVQQIVIKTISKPYKLAHCKASFVEIHILTVVNIFTINYLLLNCTNSDIYPLRSKILSILLNIKIYWNIFCMLGCIRQVTDFTMGLKLINILNVPLRNLNYTTLKNRLMKCLLNNP